MMLARVSLTAAVVVALASVPAAFAEESASGSTTQPTTGTSGQSTTQPAETGSTETAAAAETNPAGKADDKKVASYGIGFNLGQNMKENGISLDSDELARGLSDAMAGRKATHSEEELTDAMTNLRQEMIDHQQNHETEAGKAAIEKNKMKENVVTTDTGLQIETLKEGTGAMPSATSRVKVHYTGKLLNGTTFDSSVDRGQPAVFGVNEVIPGWTEALQKMKVGGKVVLTIPPALAYGQRGSPPVIPPNATLVFEVELLDIEK